MAYQISKGDFRLPMIKAPEDVDRLAHLTDEEKKFAKLNLPKVPRTEGWWMLGCDPISQALWQMIERVMTASQDGDFQGKRFGFMHLSLMVIAKHFHCEYLQGVFATLSDARCYDNDVVDGVTKLLMIDYPETDCWTREESLSIRFTKACLDNTMTDELFQEALDTWGETMTVRHLNWIGYGMFWQMFENATHMPFKMEYKFPRGRMSDAVIEGLLEATKPAKPA